MNLFTKSLFVLIVTNSFNSFILEVTTDEQNMFDLAGCDHSDVIGTEFEECAYIKWSTSSEEVMKNQRTYCCCFTDYNCAWSNYAKSQCKPKQPDFDKFMQTDLKDTSDQCMSMIGFEATEDKCSHLISGFLPTNCSKYNFPQCWLFNGIYDPTMTFKPTPETTTPQTDIETMTPKTTKPQNSFRALCLESVPILICLVASLLIIF